MAIGAGISLYNLYDENWEFPFYLAAGITTADEGKAVAIDTAAANTVKLAGDGDRIIGRLERVENRSIEGILVGTVSVKGSLKFPLKAAEVVNVGDRIVGAGSGEVKADAAVADVATVGGNTYTDATLNATVNAIEARLGNRTLVVEVGADFVAAILS